MVAVKIAWEPFQRMEKVVYVKFPNLKGKLLWVKMDVIFVVVMVINKYLIYIKWIFFFKFNSGCNPIDQRRESRKQKKKLLREDKNIMYKNQRLLDSDDEDLKIFQM